MGLILRGKGGSTLPWGLIPNTLSTTDILSGKNARAWVSMVVYSKELIKIKMLKFGYFEKATKFEKIFHLKFDATKYCQIKSGRWAKFLWPSQNV